jgi:hypothetical protein
LRLVSDLLEEDRELFVAEEVDEVEDEASLVLDGKLHGDVGRFLYGLLAGLFHQILDYVHILKSRWHISFGRRQLGYYGQKLGEITFVLVYSPEIGKAKHLVVHAFRA